ncbi:MAG: cyclic nucleotide-binding domain-containing protein [Myxococcales bacterium]|nr:cyclic nucleotide-binding domain-containing protein [Myxococcales bacterium]
MTARTPEQGPSAALPRSVFEAPLFRGLDARAQREIEAAASVRRAARGDTLFCDGDRGETLLVVLEGEIELVRERKADGVSAVVRRAVAGDVFGEEVTVLARRTATARAVTACAVVEIPVHLFRRVAVRSGRAELAEKLERTLRRSAARDLLATMQLAQDLGPEGLDALLDAVTFVDVPRGQPVYRQGEPSTAMFLLAEGMVQLQTEEEERVRVRGYLVRGDFFGEEELETASPRLASAVASGPSTVLSVPARVVRQIASRDLDLFARLRRVSLGSSEKQREIIAKAAAGATQHVFRDLYRLQIARSLLVIDLETCVRCGQCAWACGALHGTSRLVRRGDKIVAKVDAAEEGFDVFRMGSAALAEPPARAREPRSLLLPSSCQHCENPSCMIGCPTGAIGKDPTGEVFIRDELCTGCGACARACPWQNIQMAPRPAGVARPPGAAAEELAVKCDLCRGFERGPACVQVCPTASIFRVDPSAEIGELADLFGLQAPAPAAGAPPPARPAAARAPAAPILLGAALGAGGIALWGVVMQARGNASPASGLGLAAGILAGALFVALLAYAVPKRAVRAWMKLPAPKSGPRSVTRPHYLAHLALGLFCLAGAIAHTPAPLALRATAGSALFASLLVAGLSGVALASIYAFVPRALARVERVPLLPEDFRGEREALEGRLFRAMSGKSDLVKAVCDKIVIPYVRAPLGWARLVASARDLRREHRALRSRIDVMLEGRGREKLTGLDEICRVAIELRALPAQRVLLGLLRAPLPVHLAAIGVASALLVIHVVRVIGGLL